MSPCCFEKNFFSSSPFARPNEILSMTDTMEPLRVDGYEFSDARLSARDSGVFSATVVDDVEESDVGESFELRRLQVDAAKIDSLWSLVLNYHINIIMVNLG